MSSNNIVGNSFILHLGAMHKESLIIIPTWRFQVEVGLVLGRRVQNQWGRMSLQIP